MGGGCLLFALQNDDALSIAAPLAPQKRTSPETLTITNRPTRPSQIPKHPPQEFFSPLPSAIAALLRTVPCIPAAGGGLVAPPRALVCAHPRVLRLVADPTLREVLGLRLADGACGALHESPRLRQLLGVADMSPTQVRPPLAPGARNEA